MKKNLVLFYLFFIVTLAVFLFQPQALQAIIPSYTISGQVLSGGGRGVDGVTIAFFDGGTTEYEVTAGGGYYSHTVDSSWSGTVTPTDNCYSFTPASASIGPVTGNVIQDFQATLFTYTISGVVTDGSSNPLFGVVLTLSTGPATVSGPDGSYSFTVNCGWSGTVTPMRVGWDFAPPSRFYEGVNDDFTNQDYIGTESSTTYTISGTVTDERALTGMDGVTITFFDGSTIDTEVTSGGGNYSYTAPVGWTGTVTPTLNGYSFTPAFAAVGPLTSNVTRDFTGTPVTITISGSVVDNAYNPIPGVTMSLSTGASTTTNAFGNYSVSVAYGWSGTMTPSLAGWSFSPRRRIYNNLLSDQINQHYVGTRRATRYTISGTVTSGGAGLEEVTMWGLPGSPVTDASGYYSAQVNYGWSGTVTPSKSGYIFTPSNISYTNVTSNKSNQNYSALSGNPVISGTVKQSDGTGVPGVSLAFSEEGGTVYTDENGNYSHTVPSGWSGTVTPAMENGQCIFDPSSRTYTNVVSDQINQDYIYIPLNPPVIVLNRSKLNFGADTSGSGTGAQSFLVSNGGGGTLNWTITADQGWLNYTPSSGSDSGAVTVSVDPSGLGAGTHNGNILVSDDNASNSPQTVKVVLEVYSTAKPPFGDFSTPIEGSTVSGGIPVTGWALDDIGVESVKIYREENGSLVFIGDAVFVEGARPDVELFYPGYPNNFAGGWGYMMLTHFLPNGGNGTYTLHAVATDLEGNEVTLGTKTFTCDNANAVKPFGMIDTPEYGGEASGSEFRNHGWVLTPQPNSIPTDGSTIDVYVDGVNLGHPAYNFYREDVAALFPGYANSNGAHGYFDFDTTAYTNGVHTIYWTATDDAGNTDGIGSRFFTIQNNEGARSMEQGAGGMEHGVLSNIPVDYDAPVEMRKGFGKDVETQRVSPNSKGMITFEIKPLERIEIRLAPLPILVGCHVIGKDFRALPVGSTLDLHKGIFCWLPGPGVAGIHHLLFVVKDQDGTIKRKDIMVKIGIN